MTSRNPTSWASLPAELRLKILEPIIHEKPPGWTSLASVCKEWQPVFEKENYKKIKLRSSRLGEFESMVPPQKRHLIRHVWLDIELRRYSTRCCTKRNSQLKTLGPTVTKAIRRIFSILSNWEAGNGLTLELNVVCPSDSEHWFRNLHFSSDCVDDEELATRGEADHHHHDPSHGWLHGAQVEAPARSAMYQLFLPKSVQRVVMFQESTELYNALSSFDGQRQRLGHHDRYDEAFAHKSLELHHLAVSFMVDAEQMFTNCQPTWIWPNLQTLSLTSLILQSDVGKRGAIEALLCRAGELVRQMPKMRTLVLWNGGKDHACAFMYCVDENDYPSITWRGTWDMVMSPRIVESWQDVASTFPSCRLDVRNEHIGETVGSHGDAIYYLRLPLQVVEPASLWQMRREARDV
ncbi:hypothetical protein TRIATDRAFT_191778 [Trichoderma atroviride IMI 206040]|uniref:DUF6546 domain-containing protein n=1 Tax=Hypocrea atroviridis (strain ATCC 20476 / IMI 206040) TaxID=452589 RepID=G9NLN8_HYPAI|nr:uncharacterized protein TRIATDRAFT_191778 [Trichoderma atroviride IMI 206040]EHK48800.1 hypothetical protein TRIATDRAFT_191778 [Trichoderma atroviride IMI 206040]